MKKSFKIIMTLLTILSFLIPLTVHATQGKTQTELNTAKDRLAQLESSKSSVKSYISELNTQITDINNSITGLEKKQEKKEAEIEEIQEALEEAKEQEKEQYEAMKKRIKFLYESDNLDIVSIILGAQDMPDMLNQIEFVKQISDYDRDMLLNYQTIKADIETQEAALQNEKTALASLMDDKETEKGTLDTLLSSASAELSQNDSSIAATQQQISAYEEDLKKQEEEIAKAQAKENARKATTSPPAKNTPAEKPSADKDKNNNSNTNNPNPENPNTNHNDLELLAAIIECEAGGESLEGKIAVGNVVMNRVRSGSFPNTVLGVIYQNGQFSPVTSGRYALVLARGASSSCKNAASQAMAGTNYAGSCLYFRPVSSGFEGLTIGNHVFF